MTKEERELNRFVFDPDYRKRVIARIHRERDDEYNRRIKQINYEIQCLQNNRFKEIDRIINSRWEKLFDGKLFVNKAEGKIKINKKEYFFSDIKGAELNFISGYKTETNGKTEIKTKKHASFGGAVMGGFIAGPIGAVAGASSLGKSSSNANETYVSNEIPICFHLGVLINLNNFITEVVFISSETEQTSKKFNNIQIETQNFILQLNALAQTPVPINYLKPENEKSVQNFNVWIYNKQLELEKAIANKPTYKLPPMYRLSENSNLSDEEYLQYLYQKDEERKANKNDRNMDLNTSVPTGLLVWVIVLGVLVNILSVTVLILLFG